jgi:hypothetical protein
MAHVMIFAIEIASAVSLLIVSPHQAQRKALRALRAYGETEALPTGGRGEDLARPARDIFTSALVESAAVAVPCPDNAEYGLQINRS